MGCSGDIKFYGGLVLESFEVSGEGEMHNLIRSQHSSRGPVPNYTRSANPSTAPPADDRSYPWKRTNNENNIDDNANYSESTPRDIKSKEEPEDGAKSGDETEEESEVQSEPPKKSTPKFLMTGLRDRVKQKPKLDSVIGDHLCFFPSFRNETISR